MPQAPNAYRIEFGTAVWNRLGTVGREAYLRLKQALDAIAAEAPRAANESDIDPLAPPRRQQISVGPLSATYEVDHVNSTILILEVVPDQAAASPQAASEPGRRR